MASLRNLSRTGSCLDHLTWHGGFSRFSALSKNLHWQQISTAFMRRELWSRSRACLVAPIASKTNLVDGSFGHERRSSNNSFSSSSNNNGSSSMRSMSSSSWPHYNEEKKTVPLQSPAFVIWGSNTGVGKTLVSAGLVRSILLDEVMEGRDAAERDSRVTSALGDTDENVTSAERVGSRQQLRSVRGRSRVTYLKPVQTGFPEDSDADFVRRNAFLKANEAGLLDHRGMDGQSWDEDTSRAAVVVNPLNFRFENEAKREGDGNGAGAEPTNPRLTCVTLFAWREAVSPHLAVEREARGRGGRRGGGEEGSGEKGEGRWEEMLVSDEMVVESMRRVLLEASGGREGGGGGRERGHEGGGGGWGQEWVVVETAGGVNSPGPSGSLQSDIYRPLRLPAVLVGDGSLGGISSTLSAIESLQLRGFDVAALAMADGGLENHEAVGRELRRRASSRDIPCFVLPPLPSDPSLPIGPWLLAAAPTFNHIRQHLTAYHQQRVEGLAELAKRASDVVWWPFTQHGAVGEEDITVIDSRCGEDFAVFKEFPPSSPPSSLPSSPPSSPPSPHLSSWFDACASWWTQGPNSALQSELAMSSSYAIGRYGHVMFPEASHLPAVKLAEILLGGVGRGWASRVFFSDNGSTAIEVALKMAFRKYGADHPHLTPAADISDSHHPPPDFKVLALEGSYHGDTLGAMNAQSPSPYTAFKQQAWYGGRGVFLKPPTVQLKNATWHVDVPAAMGPLPGGLSPGLLSFESREEIFSISRDTSPLSYFYSTVISQAIDNILSPPPSSSSSSVSPPSTSSPTPHATPHIAALIIEPVIHGAGGMELIDPLFQRQLVSICRQRAIPVIFDEVFAGCWRLGAESAAQLLSVHPDIACYAKLLTGGVVPLAVTLATSDVFDAFKGTSKLDALLHGHSYTAHPIGCMAALTAMPAYSDPDKNENYNPTTKMLREFWDPSLCASISSLSNITRVVALGCVFAAELKTEGAGYGSTAAKRTIDSLREMGIFARPLGNVVYFMCTPFTSRKRCNEMLGGLHQLLKEG